jgi:hypothetical protein
MRSVKYHSNDSMCRARTENFLIYFNIKAFQSEVLSRRHQFWIPYLTSLLSGHIQIITNQLFVQADWSKLGCFLRCKL